MCVVCSEETTETISNVMFTLRCFIQDAMEGMTNLILRVFSMVVQKVALSLHNFICFACSTLAHVLHFPLTSLKHVSDTGYTSFPIVESVCMWMSWQPIYCVFPASSGVPKIIYGSTTTLSRMKYITLKIKL